MLHRFLDWLYKLLGLKAHLCGVCGSSSFRRFKDTIVYLAEDCGKNKLHEMRICKNCADIMKLIKVKHKDVNRG